jgi:hypothetical protein
MYVSVGFVYVISILWIYVLGHHFGGYNFAGMNDKGK